MPGDAQSELDPAEARIAGCLAAEDLHGAASEALRAYGPSLLRYLRATLGDDDVACEVFSDACERLWTALPRFRGDASVRTWAFRLAWRTAQDWKRRAARRRVRRLDTSEAARIAAEIRSTTPAEPGSDASDRWAALKASLSDDERSLLVLRIDQRLAWRDVARVMAGDGSAPEVAALRKRFERLKLRLRALAARHGLRSRAG